MRHYVHVGTGNYHPQTARLYTDFGLFTCRPELGADVGDMFNFLTGFARPRRYRKVLVAPTFLRDAMLDGDRGHDRGAQRRQAGAHRDEDERARRPADHPRALPRLTGRRAGRPQHPRHLLSRARARGRLGEHPRGLGRRPVPRALADLRVRARRVDPRATSARPTSCRATSTPASSSIAPVEDPILREDLLDTLERSLADETNAWELQSDQTWKRRTPSEHEPRSVQRELMVGHAARAAEAQTQST